MGGGGGGGVGGLVPLGGPPVMYGVHHTRRCDGPSARDEPDGTGGQVWVARG